MKKYKVRIKEMPSMTYGGQKGYSLDLGHTVLDEQMREDSPYNSVSDTLQPVPRAMANLEAEKGETVVGDLDGDGMQEHMKIGGKRHSEGGTPLNLNPGSFIFSDTKKMEIGGPALAMFGKSSDNKKKYTPAQLAKQYDLNKYKAMLDDPTTDPLKKSTAQMMMQNNQKKLGQLALLQESMKGFPQGIPDIAQSVLPQAAYGGYLPKAQTGIEAYPGDKYSGVKNASKYTSEQLRDLAAQLGFGSEDTLALQRDMLDNPEIRAIVEEEHNKKGMPLAGKMDDGYWGYRWDAALEKAVQRNADRLAQKQIQPLKTNIPAPVINREKAMTDVGAGTNGPQPGEARDPKKAEQYGYLAPDRMAAMQAYLNRATLPNLTPFMATPGYVKPRGVFMDPTRDYAANAEMANMQMQALRSMGRPQSVLAGASQIAGKNIQANEAIASAVNRQNAMLANQLEAQGTALDNQYLANRAQANNLYAEMARGLEKENFRNRTAADAQILAARQNMFGNRAMLNMVNNTNPYYAMDPMTGMVNLKATKNPFSGAPQAGVPQNQEERLKYYLQRANELFGPSGTAATKERWAMQQAGYSNKTTVEDNDNDMYPDRTRTTGFNPMAYLPYFMNMFGNR